MCARTMENIRKFALCRLCLQNNQSLVDIFEENVEHGFIIKDTIEDLMQFEVSQVKGVPWMACSRCLVKLNDFRLFKIQCIDSKIAFENKFVSSGYLEDIPQHMDMSDVMDMKLEINDSHMRQDLYPEIEISPVKAEPSEAEIAHEFYPQVILKTMDENDCLESSSTSFNHASNDVNGLISQVEDSGERVSEVPLGKTARRLKRKKLMTNCITPQIDITRVKAEFQRQLRREVIPNDRCHEDAILSSHLVKDSEVIGAAKEEEVSFGEHWNGSFRGNPEDKLLPVRQQKRNLDTKSYTCTFCGKNFQTRSELKRHSRCHTGERPYLCDICGISFARRYHLVQHNMIHTGEKPFRCENCDKCFSKSSHLNRHRRTHTGERPYSCLICGKSFSLNYNLNAHMKVHCVEGQEQDLPCPHCDKRFNYKHNLLQHLKRHETQGTHDCSNCGETFLVKGDLARHSMENHPTVNPHCCVECLECFPNESDLALHTQTAHLRIRPYTCEICNNTFAGNGELTKHRHTHGLGPKRFFCAECDKSFNRRSRLQRHLVSVHGKTEGLTCNERRSGVIGGDSNGEFHDKLIVVQGKRESLVS